MKKDLLLGIGIGTIWVIILFALSEGRVAPLSRVLLAPGALMADAAGVGVHDLGGMLLYVFVNIFCYSVVGGVLIRLLRLKNSRRSLRQMEPNHHSRTMRHSLVIFVTVLRRTESAQALAGLL